MNQLSQEFAGQDVALVIRGSMPLTILGKLLDTDEQFVRLSQRNNRGEMLIPINAVMHITLADGHDADVGLGSARSANGNGANGANGNGAKKGNSANGSRGQETAAPPTHTNAVEST